MQAITNATVFTGEKTLQSATVVFDEEKIHAITENEVQRHGVDQVTDAGGDYLIPGFIDLQVNGGGGIMFNSDPSVNTIRQMVSGHKQFGTTGLMPTLITASFEKMRAAIDAVDTAIADGEPGVLGIHLEGPFLSEAKKGAHDPQKFRRLDEKALDLLSSLKHGKTIVTLAPELTEPAFISALRQRGIIVCAGHTNADFDETRTAIDAGLSGFTHLYNAMTGMESRKPGMVGAAISDRKTWFGIIADGYHVHPASFAIAVNGKQKGGAILVTDAMSTVGSADDFFELDGETIRSVDGRCINAAGSLAGSDLDMFTAVRNASEFAGLPWQEAVRMASLYPANVLGAAHGYGKITEGGPASFSRVTQNLELKNTWLNGVC